MLIRMIYHSILVGIVAKAVAGDNMLFGMTIILVCGAINSLIEFSRE